MAGLLPGRAANAPLFTQKTTNKKPERHQPSLPRQPFLAILPDSEAGLPAPRRSHTIFRQENAITIWPRRSPACYLNVRFEVKGKAMVSKVFPGKALRSWLLVHLNLCLNLSLVQVAENPYI